MGFTNDVQDLANRVNEEKQNSTTELYNLYLRGTLKRIKDSIEKNAKEGVLCGDILLGDSVVLNCLSEFDQNHVPKNDRYCDYFTYDGTCYAKFKDQIGDGIANIEIVKELWKMTWKVTLTSLGEKFLNNLSKIAHEEEINLKFFSNVYYKKISKNVEIEKEFTPLEDWKYNLAKKNISSVGVKVYASYDLRI